MRALGEKLVSLREASASAEAVIAERSAELEAARSAVTMREEELERVREEMSEEKSRAAAEQQATSTQLSHANNRLEQTQSRLDHTTTSLKRALADYHATLSSLEDVRVVKEEGDRVREELELKVETLEYQGGWIDALMGLSLLPLRFALGTTPDPRPAAIRQSNSRHDISSTKGSARSASE